MLLVGDRGAATFWVPDGGVEFLCNKEIYQFGNVYTLITVSTYYLFWHDDMLGDSFLRFCKFKVDHHSR